MQLICMLILYPETLMNSLINYNSILVEFSEFSFFRFYLFYFFYTEGKGGRKRGREISMYGCHLHAPY